MYIQNLKYIKCLRGHCGRVRMVVGCTITCVISSHDH